MKQFFPIIFIILASLSAYCIGEFTNEMQLHLIGVKDLPNSYKLLFGISKITSSMVPVVISLFMVITITIMLNDVFDIKMSSKSMIQIVGIAFIPMVIYYYFFWYNLIQYCDAYTVKKIEDFTNMVYMWGLRLNDFSLINLLCWIYMYIYIIYELIRRKVKVVPAMVSTLMPSMIFIMVYYLISSKL
ncbi:MAG: hypothetical protein K2M63_08770 [Muribaculaceae bacterium]|nr:hypothetical protein [Muribaculaceae bacterium]